MGILGDSAELKIRRISNSEDRFYKALKMLASSEVQVIIGKENRAETMRRLCVPSTALKTLSSPGKVIIINYIEN